MAGQVQLFPAGFGTNDRFGAWTPHSKPTSAAAPGDQHPLTPEASGLPSADKRASSPFARSRTSSPPPTFRTSPSRNADGPPGLGPGSSQGNGLLPGSPSSTTLQLPKLAHSTETSYEYQSSHHQLRPRHTGRSAFAKRYAATHMPPPLPPEALGSGASMATIKRATQAAMRADSFGQSNPAEASAVQMPWGNSSSIGDLEALDSILDQLVVMDTRMRGALLRGPLVSFETVVPEQRAASMVTGYPTTAAAEDVRDNTFLTSVKVVEEGRGEEEGEQEQEQQGPYKPSTPALPTPFQDGLPPDSAASDVAGAGHTFDQALLYSIPESESPRQRPAYPAAPHPHASEAEMEALRSVIPVPILPKLARMYITSKQTSATKVPAPPPPTADYLLRSRPIPAVAAPSYDELCEQIRDVQRQYTCGSNGIRGTGGNNISPGRMPRMQTALDMYISGLDGPLLDDVIMQMDVPFGLERSRPSFVSMKRSVTSGRARSGRSASRERARCSDATPW